MGAIQMPHLFFEDINNDPFYSDFTITLWIKPYDVVNTSDIFFQLDEHNGSSWEIAYNDGLLFIGMESSGLTLQPIPNEWNFISIVWNCELSTLWIYHNGELYDTDSNTPISNIAGTEEFFSLLYTLPYFLLSDFRIYATALSASDVLELYNTSMIVNSDGTISPRVLTS